MTKSAQPKRRWLARWLPLLQRRTSALVHDALVIPVAWFGAYALRFNLETIPANFWAAALQSLPIVFALQWLAFWMFGLYKGVWRFASVPDLLRIGKSVVTGIGAIAIALFLLRRMEGIPRTVLPLYGMLLVFLLGGSRMFYRWLKDHKLGVPVGQRVLIIGAGQAAESLIREITRQRPVHYQIIGLVDDNPGKKGRDIHGIPIRGRSSDLPALVDSLQIELLILAMPTASREEWRAMVSRCEGTGIPLRTVPGIADLVSGRMTVNTLRDVSINDLLGRAATRFDDRPVETLIKGARILITGAGGSIGAQLARQIARHRPARLYLLDQAETPLADALAATQRYCAVEPVLADIRQGEVVERLFQQFKPDIVFHAAAYKHVPLLERQLLPAIENNILGTYHVVTAAAASAVRRLVLISTDKAVEPSNIMGATKRVGERLVLGRLPDNIGMRTAVVRFGNVLDSAGSVLPLFRQQIRSGGPVTVTHPDMSRYFMTIPEACQLILHAAAMAEGKEVFVLDMGKAVRIADLAEQMIRLSGLEPGVDIKIEYTSPRPGEKLNESLYLETEVPIKTKHPQIHSTGRHRDGMENIAQHMQVLLGLLESGDELALRMWLSEQGGYRPQPVAEESQPNTA